MASQRATLIAVILFAFLLEIKAQVGDNDELRIHPYLESRPSARANSEELKSEYWQKNAQATIADKLKHKLNLKDAKNIIMFLGDGMSIHTVTATRSLIGDDSSQVSFEKFPHLGLSKTYCTDRQVADSACTATAYLSGVKGNYGTIGVNAKVLRHNCEQALDPSTHVKSIAKWAQDLGKSTGIVTTARVTHASPAGVYAHTANRDWENDAKIKEDDCDAEKNVDIARQLVEWEVGSKLNVVLGGGRAEFLDATVNDPEGLPGWRSDRRNLIEQWSANHDKIGNSSFVWNRNGLLSIDPKNTDYLLGLFSQSHCSYHGDLKRTGRDTIEPTLTEMTEIAIKMMEKNEKGYFLFVEGARIDMAHHDTKVRKSIEDCQEMANAVQKARDMTSEDDTLIVVTSDHSHTMTINGYPYRGLDIFGLSGSKGSDNLPYTILSYANGPGFVNTYNVGGGGRRDISNDDFTDADHTYPATVPLDSETHGGDDVGVFASGPYSHLFTGNYEQSYIPVLMAYAGKLGSFENRNAAGNLASTITLISASLIALRLLF